MLELLLGSGSKADIGQTFPNSGPGNKVLLKGTKDLGYFGEISAAQLFNGGELIDTLNMNSVGTPVALGYNTQSWFKFIYKGKYIFIARYSILVNVSWNMLYNLGLVYGARGNGLYPSATPTDQLLPVSKVENDKTWWLKPRMMSMLNVDPFTTVPTGYVATNTSEMTDNEWDDLMTRITNGGGSDTVNKWENYTNTQVGGAYTLGKETQSSNVNNTLQRYGYSNSYAGGSVYAKSSASASIGWRPVLELMDITGVAIKAINVYGDAKGSEPLSPDLKNQVFVNPAARVNTVMGTYDAVKSPDVKAKLVSPALAVAQPGSSTTTLKPFSVKASYVA